MTTEDTIHAPDEAWDAKVKAILKAELKRKGVTYAQLADKLAAIGVKETEPNIRNKLARGKFTAVFFMQCLAAIGCQSLDLRS
jgi:hypothetical protein